MTDDKHLIRVPFRTRGSGGEWLAVWCDTSEGGIVTTEMKHVTCPKCLSVMKKTFTELKEWNESLKDPKEP